MSLRYPIGSDHQLARLLQIGIVLEEVVEARAEKHAQQPTEDDDVIACFEDAVTESAEHRSRLEALIDRLDADTVPFEEIQMLVEQQYEADQDFDDVLYDQLCNEETAYKFYDDLIGAIEDSDVEFGVDREQLLTVLREIRDDEADGVEAITDLMEERE